MIAWKQFIVPGDRGRDVRAVKRALRRIGYKVSRTNRAGKTYEHALRSFQSRRGLHADGIYGRATHAELAPRFDAYDRWLYKHSRIRQRSEYVNPFKGAHVQVGRVDEGVDYHGYGPIHAIGDAVIVGKGGAGWPGGQYLLYRLTSGRHAGRYVYIAEGISIPWSIYAGKRVKAGQTVASFRYDSAPGMYPGIEIGWGSNLINLAYAAATHEPMGYADADSPAGLGFARFLKAVGAPAPDVHSGPEFPA